MAATVLICRDLPQNPQIPDPSHIRYKQGMHTGYHMVLVVITGEVLKREDQYRLNIPGTPVLSAPENVEGQQDDYDHKTQVGGDFSCVGDRGFCFRCIPIQLL